MIAPGRIGWQGATHRRSASFGARHRIESRSPLPRTRHRRRVRAVALLPALLVSGCTLLEIARAPRLGPCDGEIPRVSTLASDQRRWHERARYRGDGVDASFQLAAERRADRLVLVGLNAFGARVLSVTQQDDRIDLDARLGPALAVPPETVLRDWYAARAAGRAVGERFELERPECGYRATFVLEAEAPLSAEASP